MDYKRFEKIANALFRCSCIQNKQMQLIVKQLQKEWSYLQKKQIVRDDFWKLNQSCIQQLRKIYTQIQKKSCRKIVLQELKLIIDQEAPGFFKESQSYQITLMKTYLNNIINQPSQYESMIFQRLKIGQLKEKERIFKILYREIKIIIQIVLKLIDEYEKTME